MSKEVTLGLVRHGLTFIGGLLVTKGILEAGVLTEIIGGIITIVGGLWSVLAKKK